LGKIRRRLIHNFRFIAAKKSTPGGYAYHQSGHDSQNQNPRDYVSHQQLLPIT
jgi:hypothetical protein